MPPQKKSNTGLIVGLVVGGIFLCCILPVGIIGVGGFWAFNKAKGFVGCTFYFTDVRNSMVKYAEAHDGKLPNAETWQDDVREDYRQSMTSKERNPFGSMSPDGDWGCKDGDGNSTGMAFNSALSGKKLSDIKDQESVVMLFETQHPARNLHEKYAARNFESSPKIIGAPRGWYEIPVSGAAEIIDRRGTKVPVNTGPRQGGVQVNVNTSSGN